MVHGTYDIKIRYVKERSLSSPCVQKFYSLEITAHEVQIPRHHLLVVPLHAACTAHSCTNPHALLWATNSTALSWYIFNNKINRDMSQNTNTRYNLCEYVQQIAGGRKYQRINSTTFWQWFLVPAVANYSSLAVHEMLMCVHRHIFLSHAHGASRRGASCSVQNRVWALRHSGLAFCDSQFHEVKEVIKEGGRKLHEWQPHD
jgi:hypothetical protein